MKYYKVSLIVEKYLPLYDRILLRTQFESRRILPNIFITFNEDL